MLIDFDQPITDLDGQPLHDAGINAKVLETIALRIQDELGTEAAANTVRIIRDVVGQEPITLRNLTVAVLLNPKDADKLPLEKKLELGKLAERIHLAKGRKVDIDLTTAGDLRKWIGERHGPLLAYRADQLLDPRTDAEPETEQ